MSNPRARQKRSGKSIFERIAEATKGKSGAGRKRKKSVRRTTPIIASKDSEVKGKRGPSKEAESILPRVTATKSGRTVKKSKTETPSKVEKKKETKSPEVKKKSVSISASKTVTGKGGRDIKLPGTPMGGRKLANVTREQLEKLGLDPSKKSSLTKYLNAFDRLGKRPTKKSDLVAGKMMGGMMKRKGMAKGGAMKKKGYAMGGSAKKFPDLSGDGKVTQKDILMGRGVVKKKAGGMMKKKGYASGGMMKKKGYSKGGAVRKSKRGMGAATRGGGAIM